MNRRDILRFAIAAAVSAPLSVLAQQGGRTFRIGVVGGAADNPIINPAFQAFLTELGRLGFREKENLTVIYQPVVDDVALLTRKAKEFANSKVDVLVALGTESALKAVAASSRTVPIVFVANNYDPIERGYVSSLAKPGSNITGIYLRQTELAEKQVELLVEACPDRKRLAVLWDSVSADQFKFAEARAKRLGLSVHSLKMENPPYILDAAFRSAADAGAQMMLALTSTFSACKAGTLST